MELSTFYLRLWKELSLLSLPPEPPPLSSSQLLHCSSTAPPLLLQRTGPRSGHLCTGTREGQREETEPTRAPWEVRPGCVHVHEDLSPDSVPHSLIHTLQRLLCPREPSAPPAAMAQQSAELSHC
ncbi:unnamed protein product [Pleuronectes platessa]|uniref:Uncharacterized protein n=1 Tax=Pleuronectes platessa TaxID=8262 RepID=A0A9N7Z9F9_PLEPL|nr:unnamed protein product [Pleuronectes platessa]